MASLVLTRPFLALLAALLGVAAAGRAQTPGRTIRLTGTIRDQTGVAVAGAEILAGSFSTTSNAAGSYSLNLPAGLARIEVDLDHRTNFRVSLDLEQDRTLDISLQEGASITVRAEEDALTPDPANQGFSRSELLDANPGRPGVPISIPGYPSETASGGIKAPQYFAPGVAGDHGEPIAQFFQIGSFLFQNNLTANAHGNGYSDPNFVIGSTVGSVLIDNAAYNVRYGDHSINLAVTYDLKDRLTPFLQLTTDGRDGAIAAGWSPANTRKKE